MRIISMLSVLAAIVILPHTVLADEFGDRFYNQTPKGLGDYTMEDDAVPDIAMDEAANDLQDIAPATGEKQLSSEDSITENLEK